MITDVEETSRGKQLASLLKAIEDEEINMAEVRADFKARMERLHNEVRRLRGDILSGQISLIADTPKPPEEAA